MFYSVAHLRDVCFDACFVEALTAEFTGHFSLHTTANTTNITTLAHTQNTSLSLQFILLLHLTALVQISQTSCRTLPLVCFKPNSSLFSHRPTITLPSLRKVLLIKDQERKGCKDNCALTLVDVYAASGPPSA